MSRENIEGKGGNFSRRGQGQKILLRGRKFQPRYKGEKN